MLDLWGVCYSGLRAVAWTCEFEGSMVLTSNTNNVHLSPCQLYCNLSGLKNPTQGFPFFRNRFYHDSVLNRREGIKRLSIFASNLIIIPYLAASMPNTSRHPRIYMAPMVSLQLDHIALREHDRGQNAIVGGCRIHLELNSAVPSGGNPSSHPWCFTRGKQARNSDLRSVSWQRTLQGVGQD